MLDEAVNEMMQRCSSRETNNGEYASGQKVLQRAVTNPPLALGTSPYTSHRPLKVLPSTSLAQMDNLAQVAACTRASQIDHGYIRTSCEQFAAPQNDFYRDTGMKCLDNCIGCLYQWRWRDKRERRGAFCKKKKQKIFWEFN